MGSRECLAPVILDLHCDGCNNRSGLLLGRARDQVRFWFFVHCAFVILASVSSVSSIVLGQEDVSNKAYFCIFCYIYESTVRTINQKKRTRPIQ